MVNLRKFCRGKITFGGTFGLKRNPCHSKDRSLNQVDGGNKLSSLTDNEVYIKNK